MVQGNLRLSLWFTIVGSLCVWLMATAASAQTVPSNLQIVGTIAPEGILGIQPEEGDQVLVVKDGSTEASGTVLDASGAYFIEMSKTQGYNGTILSLRLRKSSGTYQLEFAPDNQFTFNGGFPFPARTTLNPTIGQKVSGGGDSGGGSEKEYCADVVDKPFTFVPGSTISSQQMNENFDRLYEAYNQLIQCLKGAR